MAAKYKLPFTGKELDEKLNKIDNIPKQLLDPDNYPLDDVGDSGISASEAVIALEVGKLSRTSGEERDGEGGLRTPEFVPISGGDTLMFTYDEDTYGKLCLVLFDSSYNFLSGWNEGYSYWYASPSVSKTCPSNASYFRAYFSTELTEGAFTYFINATEEVATRAEFKKIYIADHGYSIYGDIIDDETMHKIVVQAEGKDGNSYNITEIKAPSDNPEEATIALMNWGNGRKQFVDFSSMTYVPDNPTVEIVCQTRGGQPLPQFSVRYNDGEGEGRVRKFTVEPDCIPIRLTSKGLEVRRNNNYNNNATEEELVTINLADLYDKVMVLSNEVEALKSKLTS